MDDISPSDAPVALGILSHPRAGAPTISQVTPARPRAGDIVRVVGDGFNAIEGNPVRSSCDDVVLQPCAGEACRTGPCVNGRCPCSIENVAVQQRNGFGGNGHHLALRSRDGALLAELEPDAVTPTMLAFHMPFDCFAPLVLEVAKGSAVASTSLCDPQGCGEQPASAPCDDGNACTLGDHCDGAGSCVGGSARACAPPCLTCDGAGGCVPRPATAGCDDGNRCTTRDHCSGDANRCVGGDAVVCDGPCLTGACDPEAGCEPRPSDAACTTGDACTVGDHCSGEGDVCLPGTARECAGQCRHRRLRPPAGLRGEPRLGRVRRRRRLHRRRSLQRRRGHVRPRRPDRLRWGVSHRCMRPGPWVPAPRGPEGAHLPGRRMRAAEAPQEAGEAGAEDRPPGGAWQAGQAPPVETPAKSPHQVRGEHLTVEGRRC